MDGVPDDPFLTRVAAFVAGAKLALSTSIADASAVFAGCSTDFGAAFTVGSNDAVACTDDDPGRNCWTGGGVGI
jgi:hypothetical protein